MPDTATTTPTSSEAPAAAAETCPNCGGHVLFTIELDYQVEGGYAPDHFGVVPEVGDTISRCDDCGKFFVHVDGASPVVDQPQPATVVIPLTDTSDAALAAAQAQIAELEAKLAAAEAAAAPAPVQVTPAAVLPEAPEAPAVPETPPETAVVPDPPSAS